MDGVRMVYEGVRRRDTRNLHHFQIIYAHLGTQWRRLRVLFKS